MSQQQIIQANKRNVLSSLLSSSSASRCRSLKRKSPDDDDDQEDDEDLPSCKVRRNYVCRDCDYTTTNPREYLYHQRDRHGQKGPIHECPYCIYASPHTHKLNRHIAIVHAINNSNNKMQQSLSQGRGTQLPPLPLLHSAAAPSGITLPPELEVILVEDDNGATGGSGSRKTMKPFLMEPSISVLPIPPPPKLTTRPMSPVRSTSEHGTAQGSLLRSVLNVQEYSCSMCSFRSKSRILVQRHEKVSHLKKKFFRCTKCKYVTNVRSRYTKHLRYHDMPYIKCELCDFSTPYKWNLDRHMRHHTDPPDCDSSDEMMTAAAQQQQFRCERCSFVGSSSQSLNSHVLNHHGGKPRPRRIVENSGDQITMSDDDQDYGEDYDDDDDEDDGGGSLVIDMASSEPEGDSAAKRGGLENGLEDEGRSDGGNTSEHDNDGSAVDSQRSVTETDKKASIHTCSECGDRFATMALLDRHMYECHDIENPRIPPKRKAAMSGNKAKHGSIRCDVCSYEAKWISEMVKHRRVHSQEKPFSCPHCEFRSRWKGDITRHLAKHHKDTAAAKDCPTVDVDLDKPAEEDAVTDNIECLMDQSMMVGGEDELCLLSEDGRNEQQQDLPLDLTSTYVGTTMDSSDNMVFGDDDAASNGVMLPNGRIARKKYQCPYCTYLTSTPSRFHMHIVAHVNPKPFMCSECGYRSNWQWDITKHAKMKAIRDENHLNASVVLVNEYGTTNYDRYEQYLVYETDDGHRHQAMVNSPALPAPKVTYKCKYCDFKSSVKKTVMRHMVVHSDSKNARFWCGVCGQSSNWKHVILRHCHHVHGTSGPILLKDSMPNSDNPEELPETSNNDSSNRDDDNNSELLQQLQEQRQQESGNNGENVKNSDDTSSLKRHKCSLCPYRCQKLFDLRIHSYLHRPREGATFKCMFCPFYVSLKRSWLNHMKLHVDQPYDYSKLLQEIQEIPDVAVPAADSNETSSSVLTRRRSSRDSLVGGDQDGEDDGEETPEGVPRVWVNRGGTYQKMFRCRHCPHVSKKRAVILAHEIMHRRRKMSADKASYKCPHCNYTSKNAGVLTSHQKVHQQEDPMHSYVDENNGNRPPLPPPPPPASDSKWYDSTAPLCTSTLMEGGKLKIKITKSGGTNFSVLKPPGPARSSKVYHTCTECPARFEKMEQMLSHRSFHTADLPYRCDQCTYTARHRPHLLKHERVHTAEYLNVVQRNVPVGSSGSTDLASVKNEREENKSVVSTEATPTTTTPRTSSAMYSERKHRCQMCPAIFLKYSTLIYHMHLHNSNGKFKCEQCTYSVSNIGNLARHVKVHDELQVEANRQQQFSMSDRAVAPSPKATASKPRAPSIRQKSKFTCDKCPASFEKRMRYDVHVTLHGSNFRFKCDRCDYAVNFAAILTRHKALHNVEVAADDNLPATVLVVKEDLKEKGEVKEKEQVKEKEEVEKEFVTPSVRARKKICKLGVVQKQQVLLLQRLNQNSNPGNSDMMTDKANRKLYCCDRCPYASPRIDAVQSHQKRHVLKGRESSRCPHCDYGTSIHSFLREHLKLHFRHTRNRPEGFLDWQKDFQVCCKDEVIFDTEQMNESLLKVETEVKQLLAELVRQVDECLNLQNFVDSTEGKIMSDTSSNSAEVSVAGNSEFKSFPELAVIKRLSESSSATLLVSQRSDVQSNKIDTAEYRELMEVALCLGYSA